MALVLVESFQACSTQPSTDGVDYSCDLQMCSTRILSGCVCVFGGGGGLGYLNSLGPTSGTHSMHKVTSNTRVTTKTQK